MGGPAQAVAAIAHPGSATRSRWVALQPVVLGVASGLLAGLSFRSVSAGPLVFVAFVPMLLATLRSVRAAALAGALTGVVGYATVFAWLPEPLARFQGVPLRHAWLIVVAGVAYHAVQPVLFALGAAIVATGWRLERTSGHTVRACFLLALGLAALWVVLEWGYPKVFPWSLGGALVGYQPLRQAADIGGVYGLGFVIILVNGALALALAAPPASFLRRRTLVAAVGAICALATYGYWRTASLAGEPADRVRAHAVEIGIVQAALPTDHHYDDTRILDAWDAYERLTHRLLAGESGAIRPDVVIWPETTLPVYLRDNAWYRARVEQFVNGISRPLIVGALDRAEDGAGEFNSAYAFMPAHASGAPRTAHQLQVYHKSYLVPWAEYVPGGRWLPFFRDWRTTGEFVAGEERDSFALSLDSHGSEEPLRVAPSICFEALQAGWFNPLVRGGASVLLNITDDGWLAGSPGPDLHLQLARMRAVETRRWLVRASNSGVSAFIDPTGEIVASLPFGEAATLRHTVFASDQLTPYVRFGDWVVWLSLVIVVVAFAWALRSAREHAA
jgi:apolipoprotein N-acyltransferase